MMTVETDQRLPFEEIAEEFAERYRRGENPSIVDYADRYPELANDIRALFPALTLMEKAGHAAATAGGSTYDIGKFDTDAGTATARAFESLPKRIGRFEIRGVIGAGGFGVVFEAHDPQLNRPVAIKVPHPEVVAAPEMRNRFVREAEAAAALDHPGIVPVYESGSATVYFIASAFVDGKSLGKELADRQSPCDVREAARLMQSLAQAVHHAHSRGVLHRDLKPANVLLESEAPESSDAGPRLSFDGVRPRITDFGLARFLDAPGETRANAVVGTASYMAPEQAEGRNRDVTTTADIYALGAILYELLTGRPPFRGETTLATLQAVRTQEPVAPSRLNPSVPRDLEAVCLKCLEKSPHRRYSTADALAEDLTRFLSGEAVAARAVGRAERLRRWARRNPGVALLNATIATLLVALLIGAVVSAVMLNAANRLAQEHLESETDARVAEAKAKDEALHRLYELHKSQAVLQRQSGRPGQREGTLLTLQKAAELADRLHLNEAERRLLRNEAIAALSLLDASSRTPWPDLPKGAFFSVDARLGRYAVADRTELVVRRTADYGEVARFHAAGKRAAILGAQLSGDGKYVAFRRYGNGDSRLEVWDLAVRNRVFVAPRRSYGRSFEFSDDGTWFAVSTDDNHVDVLRVPEFHVVTRFAIGGRIFAVRFDPSAKQLAVSWTGKRLDGRIDVIQLTDGKHMQTIRAKARGAFRNIEWGPRGRRLAMARPDDTIAIRQAATGALLRTLYPGGHVVDLQWHPAGRYLFSTGIGSRETTRAWDLVDGRVVLTIDGRYPLLSRDGANLSGSEGKRRLVVSNDHLVLPQPINQTPDPSVHPSGRLMFTGSLREYRWTDLNSGACILSGNGRRNGQLTFAPAGDAAFLSRVDGLYRLAVERHVTPSAAEFRIGPPKRVQSGEFARTAVSPSGVILATIREEGRHRFIVLDSTFHRRAVLGAGADNGVLAELNRDGSLAVLRSTVAPGAGIWDTQTGRLLRTVPSSKFARAAFHPNGRTLAINDTSQLSLHDARTGRVLRTLPHTDPPNAPCVACSPDGNQIAFAAGTQRIQFADPRTLEPIVHFDLPPGQRLSSLAFTPDGRRLLAIVNQRGWALHVWDLLRIRRRLRSLGLDWNTPPLPTAATDGRQKPVSLEWSDP